jgi:hypothetical protein
MNIWKEIKKGCIDLAIFLFERYVDMYIWINKQTYLTSFFDNKVKCIEPENPEWIHIYSFVQYELCETVLDTYSSIEEEYTRFFNKKERFQHLFLAKKDGLYISRGYEAIQCDISFLKSKVEFTYVEYYHPRMNSTIELIIPEGMWVVGNQLFTPAFILRLLQCQTKYYLFDMNYKLNIIDHEIKNLTLSSNTYIILDRYSYGLYSIHLGE